jgi:cytochrome c peroxidase
LAPLDFGCGNITGKPADDFTFRTPPLRNAAVTGPWMHNGAYTTLEAAVRHHLDPTSALVSYDPSQLAPALQPRVRNDPATIHQILAAVDPLVSRPVVLRDHDVGDLLAFLHSLTSPTLGTLPQVIPDAVPSGLPVDRVP